MLKNEDFQILNLNKQNFYEINDEICEKKERFYMEIEAELEDKPILSEITDKNDLMNSWIGNYNEEREKNIEILQKIDDICNETAIFASYANIITLMFFSAWKSALCQGKSIYNWDFFLRILRNILEKTIRDLKNE